MNIGLILTRMHSNKKAMLWVVETSVMKLLGENRVSFDTPFVSKFKPHNDSRDERPHILQWAYCSACARKAAPGDFQGHGDREGFVSIVLQ